MGQRQCAGQEVLQDQCWETSALVHAFVRKIYTWQDSEVICKVWALIHGAVLNIDNCFSGAISLTEMKFGALCKCDMSNVHVMAGNISK